MAARRGFEPRSKDPKSFVLPLHHRALINSAPPNTATIHLTTRHTHLGTVATNKYSASQWRKPVIAERRDEFTIPHVRHFRHSRPSPIIIPAQAGLQKLAVSALKCVFIDRMLVLCPDASAGDTFFPKKKELRKEERSKDENEVTHDLSSMCQTTIPYRLRRQCSLSYHSSSSAANHSASPTSVVHCLERNDITRN